MFGQSHARVASGTGPQRLGKDRLTPGMKRNKVDVNYETKSLAFSFFRFSSRPLYLCLGQDHPQHEEKLELVVEWEPWHKEIKE